MPGSMTRRHCITRFGLIRHAETRWNREKRIQGQSDSPLTLKGRNQAREWGQTLQSYRWHRILASDTGRALATADLVNAVLQVPVVRDPRLREQDWGRWTGETLMAIRQRASGRLAEQGRGGWEFCPPGGEDRNRVWERSYQALEEAAEKWPGRKILVITHEGVVKCLTYRFCDRRFLPTEPPLLRPRHLHWLVHDRNGLRLDELNALALHSNGEPG